MGWESFIVPVIVVAVWIIATLLRGAEQAKGGGQPGGRRQGKATDLDRFLREVQRRRQAAERPEERAERRSPPVRTQPSMPPPESIPVALPVEEVAAAVAVPTAPVLAVVEAAPPLPPPDMSARGLPPRPESQALAGLRKLMRSREGLRQAMILREVLGPPLARRALPR